jgi:hypothetical protein
MRNLETNPMKILEIKNAINQIKNTVEVITNRLDNTEKIHQQLKARSF